MKIWINDQDMPTLFIADPWYAGPGIKLINIWETLPF